jgi:hypothetical protein
MELLRQRASNTCAPIKVPKSSERINRVLKFMDNFLLSVEVQIASLDAVLSYARNADAPRSCFETNLIPVVYLGLTNHTSSAEVVWRVSMAYSLVAAFHSDLAFEIAKTGAHLLLIENYPTYKKANNVLVQQQILWLLASLLQWQASKHVLNRQAACMDFFKQIIQDFDDLKVAMANDPASRKKVSLFFLDGSARAAATVTVVSSVF